MAIPIHSYLHQVQNIPPVSDTPSPLTIDVEDFGSLGEEMEDEEDILMDADQTDPDLTGDEDETL